MLMLISGVSAPHGHFKWSRSLYQTSVQSQEAQLLAKSECLFFRFFFYYVCKLKRNKDHVGVRTNWNKWSGKPFLDTWASKKTLSSPLCRQNCTSLVCPRYVLLSDNLLGFLSPLSLPLLQSIGCFLFSAFLSVVSSCVSFTPLFYNPTGGLTNVKSDGRSTRPVFRGKGPHLPATFIFASGKRKWEHGSERTRLFQCSKSAVGTGCRAKPTNEATKIRAVNQETGGLCTAQREYVLFSTVR